VLEDTKEVVLLLEDRFINVAVSLSTPSFLEHLQHLAPLPDLEEGWYVQDGLLCDAGERIIVPGDVGLCTNLIQLIHNVPHMGHQELRRWWNFFRGTTIG
jgi:hypothetical protein